MPETVGKAQCPACGRTVDRVDGEYARHYVEGVLCVMSKREVRQAGLKEARDGPP
jgi:hypothetical protein